MAASHTTLVRGIRSSPLLIGASVVEWLGRLALKLLVPLRFGWGSNPMRGSCQLLTEGCQERPVPPAVDSDRNILPNKVEKLHNTPSQFHYFF